MDYLKTSAVLSDCGTYRYTLAREWDPAKGTVVFCMLNPSTADADRDDPTIRRCVGFADRWGYGRLVVVNLFAYRSASPAQMCAHVLPVGPDNDAHIARECAGRHVVLAWGSATLKIPVKDVGEGRAEVIRDRPGVVAELIERAGGTLWALGLTADDQPRHPLYVRGDAARKLIAGWRASA